MDSYLNVVQVELHVHLDGAFDEHILFGEAKAMIVSFSVYSKILLYSPYALVRSCSGKWAWQHAARAYFTLRTDSSSSTIHRKLCNLGGIPIPCFVQRKALTSRHVLLFRGALLAAFLVFVQNLLCLLPSSHSRTFCFVSHVRYCLTIRANKAV